MNAKKPNTAKRLAYIAVTCALLIGGQLALSSVAGIEIVTVLLLCFSFCFGVKCGVLCAVAFSLLRCFIWGFYPATVALYLIYYPLFALLFGLLGKINGQAFNKGWPIAFIMLALAALCLCLFIFDLIKISKLYKTAINVLLCILAGLFFALFLLILILNKKKTAIITSVAAICTVCFTLLDDVITPLILGWTAEAALTYFYSSFIVMLPQTVCTVVTVSLLFYPVTRIMQKL